MKSSLSNESSELQSKSETTTHITPDTSSTPSPSLKPNGSKRTTLIVVLVLILAITIGSGFYVYQSQNSEDEAIAYSVLENNENPKDYEDFIAKYPDSPYIPEVKRRLYDLQRMLQRWAVIALSDQASDFVRFKEQFSYPHYVHLCDLKIDSLDFVRAQRLGTEEAFQSYLDTHPDGRYASEASIAQGMLRDQEIAPEERDQVVMVIQNFFEGFSSRDEALICANITATMDRFLHQTSVTKADVINTINAMFNDHIESCQFIVNRDLQVTRQAGSPNTASYQVQFTVDQHIERDDEGKTFGSYRCTAEVTPQLLISSLTMQEVSRQ